MADKLLKLIILVLFISFQTVSSDEGLNPKGKSLRRLFAAFKFLRIFFLETKMYFTG